MSKRVQIGDATLYLGDCREILPTLPEVKCVVTSPPYNLGCSPWRRLGHWKHGDSAGGKGKWRNGCDGGGVQYGTHIDAMPWPEYVAWQHEILRLLWTKISDSGAIFYNHKPRVIGAKLWTPIELIPDGVDIRQIIIWARPGGMNFNPTAFVPTHEWIMLLAKPAFRLKSRAVSGLGDVWSMNPERNTHPAPFPIELPTKALEASEAGSVLDPFMGSGTTGLACVNQRRRFTGIEIDPRYFDIACERIAAAYAQQRLFA
jgi:site-specific DNA-methyltransferase (adenine-specific)